MDLKALPPASRLRCAAALAVGSILWLAGTVLSQVIPSAVLGFVLVGAAFALVALIQLVLGPLAVWIALRIPRWTLADIGVTSAHWRSDLAIGLAVAVMFALLQFLLIIPATGGAERSDIVANLQQIGHTVPGLLAFVALALAGGISEELFFRGLLLNGFRRLFGNGKAALVAAAALVIVIFASLHGYQGWAGMVDTALYGGLIETLLYLGRGGRLIACLAAHAGWNILASVVLWSLY